KTTPSSSRKRLKVSDEKIGMSTGPLAWSSATPCTIQTNARYLPTRMPTRAHPIAIAWNGRPRDPRVATRTAIPTRKPSPQAGKMRGDVDRGSRTVFSDGNPGAGHPVHDSPSAGGQTRSSGERGSQGLDDPLLVLRFELREEGEGERSRARVFGDRAHPLRKAVALAHVRLEMDCGDVVARLDSFAREAVEHGIAVDPLR